jgi:hypothetical protein
MGVVLEHNARADERDEERFRIEEQHLDALAALEARLHPDAAPAGEDARLDAELDPLLGPEDTGTASGGGRFGGDDDGDEDA